MTILAAEVAVRIRAHDNDPAFYRGVPTTREIGDCLYDDEARHARHVLRAAATQIGGAA